MKYKAIFFDFDYTLADASDGIIVWIVVPAALHRSP